MRVVFETPPVPAQEKFVGGRVITGTAKFVVRVWDPGETVEDYWVARKVSLWRQTSLAPDGTLGAPTPPQMTGVVPVHIPAALVASLPGDALLAMQWELKPEKGFRR